MDKISKAMKWLADKQSQHTSTPVTYTQGADNYLDVPAVLQQYSTNVEDDLGNAFIQDVTDFVIKTEELPIKPKQGDRIVCNGALYEVSREGFESAWRWSNAHQHQMRIHTQLLGDA